MATVANPQTLLTPAELEERRYAVESTLGSLRIEGIELEPHLLAIFERFKQGEISLDELDVLDSLNLHAFESPK
jgi:hypothetical protein